MAFEVGPQPRRLVGRLGVAFHLVQAGANHEQFHVVLARRRAALDDLPHLPRESPLRDLVILVGSTDLRWSTGMR